MERLLEEQKKKASAGPTGAGTNGQDAGPALQTGGLLTTILALQGGGASGEVRAAAQERPSNVEQGKVGVDDAGAARKSRGEEVQAEADGSGRAALGSVQGVRTLAELEGRHPQMTLAAGAEAFTLKQSQVSTLREGEVVDNEEAVLAVEQRRLAEVERQLAAASRGGEEGGTGIEVVKKKKKKDKKKKKNKQFV